MKVVEALRRSSCAMKHFIMLAVGWVIASVPVEARVGESLDDLKARYGDPVPLKPRFPGTTQFEFRKDNFSIKASFFDGRCVAEYFRREDREITDEDIKILLKNYQKDGIRFLWNARDKVYRNNDKSLEAGREPGHRDFFYVSEVTKVKENPAKGL
ncbi:MAG TPA: hypothetical protein VLE43_08725 [Candidatus Saccharimonadia bacterium]|nr:hypothetical protein [Candidatus Saccharimonadia bacterium]